MSGGGLLVLQLIDSFTYGPPIGRPQVHVAGALRPPLFKEGGYCVFQGLGSGRRQVTVSARGYLSETFDVVVDELPPRDPVVLVALNPAPDYAFGGGATVVRATVRDRDGRALPGVPVRAVTTEESSARARLLQAVPAGTMELPLTRVAGRLQVGERLALGEDIVLVRHVDEQRIVRTTGPLLQKKPKGALLHPCIETRSDLRGEVVLAFGPSRSRAFAVQVRAGDACEEVSVEEGQERSIGAIVVTGYA